MFIFLYVYIVIVNNIMFIMWVYILGMKIMIMLIIMKDIIIPIDKPISVNPVEFLGSKNCKKMFFFQNANKGASINGDSLRINCTIRDWAMDSNILFIFSKNKTPYE